MTKLMVKSGRNYRAATLAEISEAYGQLVLVQFNKVRPTLGSPAQAIGVLRDILAGRDYEVFMVLFLDNQHRLIEASEMFRGTIDGASVHPREVVKDSLMNGAAAVVLAHNHPSGVAEPSRADELVTLRLKDALALIEVRVLDHLIVAGDKVVSLADRGVL
jgi:DNA repair protein RadC